LADPHTNRQEITMASWLFYALLSALFAGLVGVVGKIGVEEVDPITATAIRAAIMAILSILFAFAMGRTDLSKVDAGALGYIALAGLFGAASWMAYFKALSVGEASRVIPVDRTSVVFGVILAALVLGERLTLPKAVGSVLIVMGAILVSMF